MKFFTFLFVSIIIIGKSYSQEYEVSGGIYDARTNKPLQYVTVKVADTTFGTTGAIDGKYFIKLKRGGSHLIFSYIGYKTDTAFVYLDNSNLKRDIFLDPSELLTETIDVYAEDPAYEIIRNAIKYKKEFKKTLNEYEYDAYSKFVIRSNQSDIPKSEVPKDSAGGNEMGIFGILESETKGYFKKPDLQKQIVTAKKETANITRGFAIPLVVNFYDEIVDFNEFKIPTPLSDNSFDHYDYRLKGTTSIDSLLIFKIDVINNSENRPLFHGTVYISDSLFALRRVDLSTNDAAKPRGIKKIVFNQKFSAYDDKKRPGNLFWMPTDVHIFAEGSFAGLIKFEADVFTIVSDYQLNKKAPKGIFDDVIVKVMPDAIKDSSYWTENQLIKNTKEEKNAYRQIELEDRKKAKEIRFGITSLNYGKHLSSSPLSYYHFNKVEGNAALFNLTYRGKQNRTFAKGYFGYGFSDKKSKYQVDFTQRLLKDKSLSFSGNVYDKIEPLSYPDFFSLSVFYNTLKAFFFKNDKLDYFYTTGFDLSMNYSVIPQLRLGVEYEQQKQRSAYDNTNFSVFNTNSSFEANPVINDAFQRVIKARLRISPNSFRAIDWGTGDISRFRITNYPEIRLGFAYSGKEFLESDFVYRKFTGSVRGKNYVSSLINFRYLLGFEVMSGQVPFQSLLYFAANTGTLNTPLGFTTVLYQEFLGDKIFYFNFENNFGKLLWGGIPILKDFNLIGLFNMGRNQISDANYNFASSKDFSISDGIFMEVGFGISRIFDIFRIDFAWRLNNYQGIDGKLFTNLIIEGF